MPPDDPTPLGDAMTHRFPDQSIPQAAQAGPKTGAMYPDPDVPAPEGVPPTGNPQPEPDDSRPKAPPADEEPGRRTVPIDLPGREHAPERVGNRESPDTR